MKIFKKWKEAYQKWNDKYNLLELSYEYKNIELKSPIQIDCYVFLVKDRDDLMFFVKKDNWKKYIGINRDYLSDFQGNDFSHDTFYKTSDLKQIKSCHSFDIPKELIDEMFDELIKYKNDIKNNLQYALRSEYLNKL